MPGRCALGIGRRLTAGHARHGGSDPLDSTCILDLAPRCRGPLCSSCDPTRRGRSLSLGQASPGRNRSACDDRGTSPGRDGRPATRPGIAQGVPDHAASSFHHPRHPGNRRPRWPRASRPQHPVRARGTAAPEGPSTSARASTLTMTSTPTSLKRIPGLPTSMSTSKGSVKRAVRATWARTWTTSSSMPVPTAPS